MKLTTRLLAMLASVAAALFVTVGLASPASAAPRTATAVPVDVAGTLADGTGLVSGTFNVQRFTTQNNTLMAVGTYTGTVTDAAGTVLGSGTQQLALPVDTAASSGSCQILDLVLGPLDLDLLGLQVHLDTVHLNLTAQSGPGNLVGNLLCAVAHLLDGPTGVNAILNQIANLLNQLLGAL